MNLTTLLLFCVLFGPKAVLGSLSDITFAENYNTNDLPPVAEGQQIMVNVSLNVRNIFEVNEKAQYITLETSIRMIWIDKRVRSNPKPNSGVDFVSINGDQIHKFWVPDIFIDQAVKTRNPKVHVMPATLRVFPNGLIRYSARLNYDVSCNMDFHRYPVDQQTCEIKYESFGYTTDQMRMQWMQDKNVLNPNITLDQFDPVITFPDNYQTDYYEHSFPGLILRMTLARKINYHLIQTYIPSSLFVMIAWLSMAVDPTAIPGRISMVMMTLLTLMAMFSGVRQNTPKISYVSLLDIWMVSCIAFITLVLLEFPIVHTLIRKDKKPLAAKVENCALFIIPVMFAIYNIIYWSCLIYG